MSYVTRHPVADRIGDPTAAEQLLPLIYNELRKLAAAKLAQERPGQTLQATALVHEAYLRLVGGETADRTGIVTHFFATAATAMRRILVERRACETFRKSEAGAIVENRSTHLAAPDSDDELLALHEALETLAADDPVKPQLVELRYFAGLTGNEAAEVLGISPSPQIVIGRSPGRGCRPKSATNCPDRQRNLP